MFLRSKKTRKYQAPLVKVTPVVFESNFCQTVRFQIKVQDWENVNNGSASATAGEYFEDIIS